MRHLRIFLQFPYGKNSEPAPALLRCPFEDPFALALERPLDFPSTTAYPITRFVNLAIVSVM
jgi:hypothetical protein